MADSPPASVVKRFFQDVLNRGDAAAYHALLDPEYDDRDGFLGACPADAAAPEKWLHMLRQAFPDGRYMLDDVGGGDDRVVVTTTFQGTHLGPYLGQTSTGAKVSVGGVHFFRVAAGRIVEHRGYENTWPLLDVINRSGFAPMGGHARRPAPVYLC